MNRIKGLLQKSWPGPILFRNNNSEETELWFVQVSPCEIQNISLIPEHSVLLRGAQARVGMQAGIWDYLKKPFSDHFLYKTVGCILKGKSFEETPLYGKSQRGHSEEKMRIQYQKLHKRMRQLGSDGYKTQYELGNLHQMRNIREFNVPAHETIIGMDREGKLMRLVGGRHRLAVAQQIGVASMPAVLSLIHPKASGKLLAIKKKRLITGNIEDFRLFE